LVGLIVLAAVLVFRAADPRPSEFLRMRSFDVMQELFPRAPSDAPVVIVDIDEESLRRIGQWPWPRTTIATLVKRLTDAGAAVIGFDVLFAEPDRTSPALAAASFEGLDPDVRGMLERLPSNDARFAQVLRQSRVVLGIAAKERALSDAPPVVKAPLARIGADPLAHVLRYPGVVRPLAELEAAAAGYGMITIEPETDGIVRRVPLVLAVGKDLFPSLAFDMLRIATGESVAVRTVPTGVTQLLVGEYSIPTDDRGRIWVNFAKHEQSLFVSARDVLSGAAQPARFRGKLVLVGTSATGLGDLKATPLDAALPGVEVHAQILETVLGASYLTRPDWATGAEILMVAATGLLMLVLVPVAGARWTLYVLLAVAGVIVSGTTYLYAGQDMMIDGALPLATATLLYIFLVSSSYSQTEAQRRQIRSAFGQYLSPALIEQLADDPSRLKLGGEARYMTFLFCDIRKFTAISERYQGDPEGLTALINRFMTPMTNAVLARRGTIDKYMGDCLMAFWNAPLDDPQHARNACCAALDMLAELRKLNAALAQEPNALTKRLRVGIGINTGTCIVGNMGSDLRFDYSVLGDAVNVAARLEGLTKMYGVTTIIGEPTYEHVEDLPSVEVDLIAVKGKVEPSRIYTLLTAWDMAGTKDYERLRASHAKMLAAYRALQWTEARVRLAECRELTVTFNELYDLYKGRIDAFERNPPPPGWNGAHVAESK
jgi:adenylate cyclase